MTLQDHTKRWSPHNPPRPARDTLEPHALGDDAVVKKRRVHATTTTTTPVLEERTTTNHSEDDANDVIDGDATIEIRDKHGRVAYQIVIDHVGHGVAPDQPVLVPEPASNALSFAAAGIDGVQDADVQAVAQHEWEWEHRDSITLGLVGAAVLVVAAIVIAFARRQQRAYGRQQEQRLQQREPGASDIAHTLEDGTLRFDTTGIRPTRDDDEVGTPESVHEGVV